ncbi:MAG: hypothetical protein ABIG69_03010 [Bacteroidota bacterium]
MRDKPAYKLERPKIQNYLLEGTTTDMVNNMFLENPELYDYLNALEKYVDELENNGREGRKNETS